MPQNNLSTDLIRVFQNAGHLLGLIAVGLDNGQVRLEYDLTGERANFLFEYQEFPRGMVYRNCLVVTFEALDKAVFEFLMHHATEAAKKWNAIAKAGPNLDGPRG